MAAGIQQLERYELCDRIAVGGMAEVYLAKAYGAHGFEKTLAIKRILPELARDVEFEERFIAEAKLAVSLSHANIVQVFDFGRVGPTLFLVLEYVDGLDLAALLSRYRIRDEPVPLRAAFQIAIELARGLDYAHQRGVIHRDVSPSNILLSKAGDVKIADFGIAVPDASQYRRPSRQRRVMGKWRYMSPEQTSGEHLDTRSDLFSAATVMFELFTGERLFGGNEPEEIIAGIRGMEIPSASARRPGLPPRLDEILGWALSRDPAARPARAAEMQRALTEVSYESSIMCTALDVAEAVSAVLTPREAADRAGTQPLAIDGLIRQQLGIGAGDERRTAAQTQPGAKAAEATPDTVVLFGGAEQRPATIVKTGVGDDGVELWDIDRITGQASGQASGQAARAGGTPLEPAPDAAREPAPGSSAVSAAGSSSDARTSSPEPAGKAALDGGAVAGRGPRGPLLLALGLLLVAGAGSGLVWLASHPADRAAAAQSLHGDAGARVAAVDAAPARTGLLVVVSSPSGAEVWIDGAPRQRRTPDGYEVTAGAPHRVELRLEGHEPYVHDSLAVAAGASVPVEVTLQPVRVTLAVESEPSGALVRLDGRELGTTPLRAELTLAELDQVRAGKLTVGKRGYRTETVTEIEHAPGMPLRIDTRLRPAQRAVSAQEKGTVRIHLDRTWADVYLRGRKIGRIPGELELDVGKHRLRLHNPVSAREWSLVVTVNADRPGYYRVPEE